MSASSLKGLPSSSSLGMSLSIWILDFGESHHMSYDPKYFVSLNPILSLSVMIADGSPMPLAGTESGRLIGTDCRLGGLYILDDLKVPNAISNHMILCILCL